MRFLISFSFLVILFAASQVSAEIQVRIDEKGRKVFFNPVPKVIKSKFKLTAGKPVPLTYSKKAGDYAPMIEQVCAKYNVDADLVKAVIQVESAYQSNARSHAGAIGLMQLMPATAARFGVKEIFDPNENIHGGVQYLKFLLQLFNNDLPLAVAAYNAGEGAVQRFQGIPRYTETQDYVRKVLTLYGKSDYASGVMLQAKVQPPKTIYKYMDSNGNVHFTTQKPKEGAVETINLSF
ncbi:lytic transglycosylase domain-containing protein [bacterium]|nr:lytic transglycosylase domain-containing protein [bacterium]MCI0604487.1 lytic transglycosylase domain-containing protein [bacterium]